MAAALPNATFQPLEGRAHLPWAGDLDATVDAMLSFLGRSSCAAARDAFSSRFALSKAGDVWALTFDGETVHLKDARGLSDLAVLLANPGQDVAADTLWAGPETEGPLAPSDDPRLGDAALDAYRVRLRAIADELAEAEGARTDELQDERQALSREVRAALGLGGRRRHLDTSSERARKAVTARLARGHREDRADAARGRGPPESGSHHGHFLQLPARPRDRLGGPLGPP